MRTTIKYAPSLLSVVLLTGCASAPTQDMSYAPPRPPAEVLPQASEGAIYRAGGDMRLFEDNKARRVGDILTIVLSERTNASKKASTGTKKSNDVSLANPTLLGAPLSFAVPGALPLAGRALTLETGVEAEQSFSGEGDSTQSNTLQGNISVTVVDVLPNGNLVVRGEKWLTINQGDEYVRISGVVRPQDIGASNTVSSTLVADAKIAYAGKGTVADAATMGWAGKFFNSKWWPF